MMDKPVNINLNDYPLLKCHGCGRTVFRQVVEVKCVPGIAIGQPVPLVYFTIQILECVKCCTIHRQGHAGNGLKKVGPTPLRKSE